MKVAFLGLGLMGLPMAGRIAQGGHDLTVWNRSPDKCRDFAGVAASPREAVKNAEIVCLCLASGAVVGEMAAEVAETISPDAILVDFSSIGVEETRDYAGKLPCAWVDAPVSGGVPGAQSGRLVIFCGGTAESVEKLQPIFHCVASRVTHMGDLGAGQAAKLCNQLIVSANIVAIAEAMALGRALGLDAAKLPAALAGGFADSKPLQIFGPRMAGAPCEPPLGRISIMQKDAVTIGRAARAADLDLPMQQTVEDRYRAAEELGLAASDLGRLIALYHGPRR